MRITRRLKALSNSTDFINSEVTGIFTWPYRPIGTLKKHDERDSGKETEELLKVHDEDWRNLSMFLELFEGKQKAVLGWIIAALIGVLGNLAVNLGFTLPILAGNLFWMFLCIIIVALLVVFYLMFFPKVSIVFRFIPKYVSFPKGFEQHIPQGSCTKPISKIVLQLGTLDEIVTDFGALVRTALLRDSLLPSLKKAQYIRVSEIRKLDDVLPACFLEVSTNGIKLWLDPRGRGRIAMELRSVVGAMLRARQISSVYGYELDPKEWAARGSGFIDAVSDWRFENMRNAIIDQIKSG